ncbi:phosphotransferase enzyme family protein [Penicillium psychrosexuale]|uniref:phosphotransferase enzyme family protein n=1 Tax=Penicillium psychrosexuale TaxID=1002107 RepID=UPI002544E33B|nr:phosphotransferase enzyme family protein [Penicillium psychrosexuale]KAJ5788891.1 phosphotransferase enzyme family protein [Penicillium psychrosexuale]
MATARSSYDQSAPSYESLFSNTITRWIFNEKEQLRARYVKFNIAELQRVAGKAIQQDCCSRIEKIAEGGFNRVFLLTASNGQQVIARIPTSIAGPPHYTTASEVATINFLRNVLGLPVPKILAYSTSASNPVGAEYIIMEYVQGESLATRWLSLTTEEVKHVMTQVAGLEHKTFSFRFPGYGSLYHSHDVENCDSIPLEEQGYCIGPIAKREFWCDERGQLEVDRGPWLQPKDCVTSMARREILWLKNFAQPRQRTNLFMPTDYDILPEEHISLLEKFISVAPHLIPDKPGFSSPVLRHPDLNFANILLSPGSSEIVGVIDWQASTIFPFFMQTGYPDFCQHDYSQSQKLHKPSLPENMEDLSAEEQTKALMKYRMEEINLYYTAATGVHNDKHIEVIREPYLNMRQYLIQQTGYPWDADLVNLRAALIGMTTRKAWDAISSHPCPVSFSQTELEKSQEESEEWNESQALLTTIREDLGIDLEGGTTPENFERASRRNSEYRQAMVDHCEEEKDRELMWRNWPFKDDEDRSACPAQGH